MSFSEARKYEAAESGTPMTRVAMGDKESPASLLLVMGGCVVIVFTCCKFHRTSVGCVPKSVRLWIGGVNRSSGLFLGLLV